MPKPPVVKSLELRNLLSFGPDAPALELNPLNVLIGPNGSGKSNLIEAIGLLQCAPRELAVPVREGGGVRDWLWKGASDTPVASIVATIDNPFKKLPLRYRLSFTEVGQRLEVVDERIEDEKPEGLFPKPYFYFGYEAGRPMFNIQGTKRELHREEVNPQQSVLSQRRDPDQYPEVTYAGRLFESFRLYRDWNFGRYTLPRLPQPTDLPNEHLAEDFRNLGLILNNLRRDPTAKRALLENVKTFYDGADDVGVNITAGTVQVVLEERGGSNRDFTIPATRLSDGTLRWLSLLAILLSPAPPALACIEEPEIGLHPDMIPPLAKLLGDASERMQLIVTTHSDALVDALSETPESIVVVEKEAGATNMKRLDRNGLGVWLEKYTLGQLWRKGEIGGNRW